MDLFEITLAAIIFALITIFLTHTIFHWYLQNVLSLPQVLLIALLLILLSGCILINVNTKLGIITYFSYFSLIIFLDIFFSATFVEIKDNLHYWKKIAKDKNIKKFVSNIENEIQNENLNLKDTEYIKYGEFFLSLKFYTKALKQFKKALKLNPENPETYFFIGLCYENMGWHKEAKKAYNNALDWSTFFSGKNKEKFEFEKIIIAASKKLDKFFDNT